LKLKTLFEKRAVLLEPTSRSGETISDFGSTIVVTDLHIGFEEKFKSSGINIESNVEKMATELESLVVENQASNVVIAGDVKSGIDRIMQSEWENVPKFLTRISKISRVTIVPGNHDGGIQNLVSDSVQITDINGIMIDDTLIFHGHTRPLSKFKDCNRILMGHVHPIYQKRGSPLSGSPVWAFVRINRKSLFPEIISNDDNSLVDVIVIPSFNLDLVVSGYVGEEINAERRLSPIVKELRSAQEAIITTLNAEVIGDASLLPSIF
jgi:putative SbcD/Mre11-related phosphoesterase